MKKILIYLMLLALLIGAGFYGARYFAKTENYIKVYFFRDGKISDVKRDVPENIDLLYFSAGQLLKGPSRVEKEKGFFTQIPMRTKLRKIYQKDHVIFADFSKELEMYGGGTAKVQGILAQIVYTLTELKGISTVQILVNGKKEAALGSEGYIIDKPLKRKDISNY